MRQLDNPVADRIFQQLDRRPVTSVFLLRTVFQTVPVMNYALALSAVRFRDYALGTLLGLPVPVAVYCLGFDFLEHRVFHL